VRTGERILLQDLGRFLGCRIGALRKLANKMGVFHKGAVHREPAWVTAHGARRLIADIRAQQQRAYERGRRVHEENAYLRAYQRKRLAFSRAGTDAELQRTSVTQR
jgi:hypothetical protein